MVQDRKFESLMYEENAWHWVPGPKKDHVARREPGARQGVLRKLRNGEFRPFDPDLRLYIWTMNKREHEKHERDREQWDAFYEDYLERMRPEGEGENYPGEADDIARFLLRPVFNKIKKFKFILHALNCRTYRRNVRGRSNRDCSCCYPYSEVWAALIDGRIPHIHSQDRAYIANFYKRMCDCTLDPVEVKRFDGILRTILDRVHLTLVGRPREMPVADGLDYPIG
jgi:hypothetical protein